MFCSVFGALHISLRGISHLRNERSRRYSNLRCLNCSLDVRNIFCLACTTVAHTLWQVGGYLHFSSNRNHISHAVLYERTRRSEISDSCLRINEVQSPLALVCVREAGRIRRYDDEWEPRWRLVISKYFPQSQQLQIPILLPSWSCSIPSIPAPTDFCLV